MKTLLSFLALLFLSTLLVACRVGAGPATQPVTSSTPSIQAATRTPNILTTGTTSPSPLSPTTAALAVTAESTGVTCTPTLDDGVSPSYKADAPVRSSVGSGHVISGVVRSSRDCAPIANAQLELWPEYDGKGHPDEARATVFTDDNGRYRFECDLPEHIHMRISASGFRTIGQNSYHPEGRAEGIFDIVLEPESP